MLEAFPQKILRFVTCSGVAGIWEAGQMPILAHSLSPGAKKQPENKIFLKTAAPAKACIIGIHTLGPL